MRHINYNINYYIGRSTRHIFRSQTFREHAYLNRKTLLPKKCLRSTANKMPQTASYYNNEISWEWFS